MTLADHITRVYRNTVLSKYWTKGEEKMQKRPDFIFEDEPADEPDTAAPTLEPPLGRSVLHEAEEVILNRAPRYGHPRQNLLRISQLWTAYLSFPISPRDAAILMILLKAARDRSSAAHDNLIDIAGYAAIADLVEE